MVRHADDMRTHLLALKALRGGAGRVPPRLAELKRWQAARLAATYADISAEPRFHAATAFFLEDLYGAKDFSARDQSMLRIVPVMSRLLPESAVETAALAIELEALSEALDHRLAAALPEGPIDEEAYGEAYRASSTRTERERQIELIVAVGERLDALVRKPFIFQTLKLMRQPARLAGLSDLQDFLERGFEAFLEMGGAKLFLATIRERETAILRSLFSGAPMPFSPS
ncbi:MAG TPA: hypothetical protein VFK48_14795 [Usitatibacter sp.]|nr:hypothetical protein [Usitatibacter sp.]